MNESSSDQPITSPSSGFDSLRNTLPETKCPYLPDLMARNEAYKVGHLEEGVYAKLLAQNFRRSGRIIYRPRCRGCQECRQLRVPVEQFSCSRSMRRVERQNSDLQVQCGPAEPSDEKYDLFVRYLDSQHDSNMSRTYDCFEDFLYDTPMKTSEFRYSLGNQLIAVSIVDHCADGLSSVYVYFDPAYACRSLGTYSAIWEINFCRLERLKYYYLGYYVAGSKTMDYKSRFRPNEILVAGNRWISLRE